MTNHLKIRLVTPEDAGEIVSIYRHYVEETAITFDNEVPSVDEMRERILQNRHDYPWLVVSNNDELLGYAYAGRHRIKSAYQWSPESTIYLRHTERGKEIGKILYRTLLSVVRLQGFCTVYAGITVPNERSERLHRALGFSEIGTFSKSGFKLGQWHDVKWFEYFPGVHPAMPDPPKKLEEIAGSKEMQQILNEANEQLNR